MARQQKTAVLVARQGPLRDSLLALLRVLPEIDHIHYLEDIDVVPALAGHIVPGIVLIDGDLVSPATRTALRQVRTRWPETGFILFANDVEQQNEAQKVGLGLVLLKGHPAAHLVNLIKRLTTVPHRNVLAGERASPS